MVINVENSLINRERIIESVKTEIIGPSLFNKNCRMLSPGAETTFSNEEARKSYFWYNCGIKEEVLQTDYPSRRYSAGILYPMAVKQDAVVESELLKTEIPDINKVASGEYIGNSAVDDELPQSKKISSDDFLQSSLGLTCRISNETKKVKLRFNGARYSEYMVSVNGRRTKWWLRESVFCEQIIQIPDSLEEFPKNEQIKLFNLDKKEVEGFNLFLNVNCREYRRARILTVSIVNKSSSNKNARLDDKLMIFQSEISLTVLDGDSFLNYPKNYERHLPLSDDELTDELLYRNKINYAIGHGCSTTWVNVSEVKTTFLPTYETQSMTPDIEILIDGKLEKVSIRMADIANAKDYYHLVEILLPLVDGYENWIVSQENEVQNLDCKLRSAGVKNIELCKESLCRVRQGISHLREKNIFDAFILANKAMLLQQVNGKVERIPTIEENTVRFDRDISETVKELDDLNDSKNAWRAFQIAFFLMSIDSMANEKSLEREVVDLIWFPTGGGKTEAYLAVAAFQMFYRRIKNPSDAGVDVLMRYTLRLLTADQFQRSSRLICSMEYLRKRENMLGNVPFSIGMWVGGTTSPNSNQVAISKLNTRKKWNDSEAFLVNRCPWCGCALGQVVAKKQHGRKEYTILGFTSDKKRLITHCPDTKCDFHIELPIYFVDETIYEKQPTFMIGTVDKFVQLAWNPRARSIFGIDENGNQNVSPPNLIIQDELHLISGPLGTMYGLFESVIEELCTNKIDGKNIKPKIISATATIKEFNQQAKDLFAREQAKLFPSPGLDIDDSFFAKIALDEKTKKPSPGRKYVGVFTSNVGIMMSEVKVFSSILQEANQISSDERDPYWTLLAFYNSLRDLGAGINLCNMDIPTYMNAIKNREAYENNRYIQQPLELTSRLQSQEISNIIDSLKIEVDSTSKKKPIDVCLASNIIEVGVDIDRLSVMAIVGQPKTTAQYIQVTGRVGRRWYERPGVIFTLFSNRNARDKSHFEHFVEYHQKLYAQVETTSVTPFSDIALERGLSAVIIAFVRQRFSSRLAKIPDADSFKEIVNEYKEFTTNLKRRLLIIDPEQEKSLNKYLRKIEALILSGDFTSWKVDNDAQGLMFQMGDPIAEKNNPNSIGIINSLRNVDAESIGEISKRFFNNIALESDVVSRGELLDSLWEDLE